LDSNEGLNIFKEWKFYKEDFEVLLEIDKRLGSGMKFESRDFDFNEFPEMFKPFLNREFRIWLEDSNSNQGLF
jgi:hypothetical protein